MTTLQHNEIIKTYFGQWSTHRKIIESNCMLHEEVGVYLSQKLAALSSRRLRILDVGCGDAHVFRGVVDQADIETYCGIDLSEPALALAQQTLAPRVDNLRLICGDITEELERLTGSFDVILAGYSLHHLETEDKEYALRECRRLLAEGGVLIVYDLVQKEDESRDSYVLRFALKATGGCGELEVDERVAVARHILDQNYPETLAWWEAAAARAGYGQFACRLQDNAKLYAVLELAA